jgi:hypothetical protein
MSETVQTREVTPLHMRADVVPGSLNEEDRTVDVVWTTGARVKRFDWFDGPFWEELSTDPKHVRMGRLQSGRAPVLLQHNSYNPDAHQGVVMSAQIKPGQGTAKLRFLKDDPDADKTWNKIRQGILTSVSVGYAVHLVEETRGSDGQLPVRKAIDWEPYEISPVSMPADPDAHMRAASQQTNTCKFIIRSGEAPHKESKRMDPETTPTPAPPVAPPPADVEEKIRAERERAVEIRRTVRAAQLGDELADKLVADGTTLDNARALVIAELGKRTAPLNSHVRIEAGEDERDQRSRGVTALVIARSGAADIIRQARESKRYGHAFKDVATDPGEFRGMSLLDLARDVLERAGVRTRGMDRMEIARRALTFRSGGNQTTSDFSVLFENALHKLLLGAYATAPDTWRLWCATDTVSDFRDHPRYRNGSFGVADLKPEGAEYQRKAIPDGQKVAIQTRTHGNKIGLTREAIINDDMGSFTDLATRFGRMFGLTLEVNAYALLTVNSGLGVTFNGQPFFHAQNANINTTGSALSVDGIEADATVMAAQKNIGGNDFIGLEPSVLVVTRGLRGTALVINSAEFDPSITTRNGLPNKVRGMFQTVVGTPRLAGTRRYLFADPGMNPAFKMVFLEGGEAPVLESEESWDIDGTEWRVRFDAKAVPFDPKCAVTNVGQ